MTSDGWDGFQEWVLKRPYAVKGPGGKLHVHEIQLIVLGLALLIRDTQLAQFGEEAEYADDVPQYIRRYNPGLPRYDALREICTTMVEDMTKHVGPKGLKTDNPPPLDQQPAGEKAADGDANSKTPPPLEKEPTTTPTPPPQEKEPTPAPTPPPQEKEPTTTPASAPPKKNRQVSLYI